MISGRNARVGTPHHRRRHASARPVDTIGTEQGMIYRVRVSPILVLLTGPPGTGKSVLAERAAEGLGAPVLGWDWTMAALSDVDSVQRCLRDLSHTEYRRVGWSIMWNLATAQLRSGRSVVLDGVAREVEVAGTRDVVLRRWEPPVHVDLHLDAASPLDANAAQLAELLDVGA
jgi:AAA domain